MRFEDLQYFLAVAETGHVGRASERLGQSQPALTKGVQRLERELQLQLFERTSKGMLLTSVGKVFFQRARQVQFSLDEAIKEANDLHLGRVGLLRVGVPPTYLEYFSGIYSILLQQRPAARAQVMVGLNDKLFSALKLGDLDLAICAIQNSPSPELDQQALFADNLHVIARDGHPLFFKKDLSFRDLADTSWILPGCNVAGRRTIEALFKKYDLPPPNVAVELGTSGISFASMVKATDLLAIAGDLTIVRAGNSGLSPIPLKEATWPRTIGITTRRGAYLSPLVSRFIELLHEHGSDTPQRRVARQSQSC